MKIGILRCMQTEDMCPASTDLKYAREKKGAFEGIEEDIEVIGVNSCGGCPGKKAVNRAMEMVQQEARIPSYLPRAYPKARPSDIPVPLPKKCAIQCPPQLGDKINIIDYTH